MRRNAAPLARLAQARVFRLVFLVADLGDDLGALFAEQIDAADVIDVSLGEDDVARRARVDRVVVAFVHWRLEAHAGVDDDAALRRRDEIAVGEPGRVTGRFDDHAAHSSAAAGREGHWYRRR